MGERLVEGGTTQVNVNFTVSFPYDVVNFSLSSEHFDLKPTGAAPSAEPLLNRSEEIRNIGIHKGTQHFVTSELDDGETFVIFKRKKHNKKEAITTVAVVGVVFVFTILVGVAYHRRQNSYQSVVVNNSTYDYIYKPLKKGILDDEYESTFVGVDVPLLQEVSVIWLAFYNLQALARSRM